MFKAIEVESEQEVILLDTRWTGDISALRALSAADKLVCQECRKPVTIRAGEIKRKHFAHKRRADCPYGSESPILLHTRAVLYSLLKAHFGESVTLEKRLENSSLPRPVDCWVKHPKGTFAYWIIDSQIRSQETREILQQTFRHLGIPITWIFTSTLLDADTQEPACIHLTTTERDFKQKTYLDITLQGIGIQKGDTLHYLNPETEELTTYRSLTIIHPPQLYQGRRYHDFLSALKIASITGEFAHPGELDRSKALREQKRLLEEQQKEAEALRLQALEAAEERAKEQQALESKRMSLLDNFTPLIGRHVSEPVERIGVCKFCQKETSDWITIDKHGICRCRECVYDKKLF